MYESRILEMERRLNTTSARLDNLEAGLREVQQQLPRAWGGPMPSEGGGTARLGWCRVPTGGVDAATGTWPSLTPSSFTADVYVTGETDPVAEGATIVWKYLDGADEGKLVPCYPNTDDLTSWDAILDSCTGVDLDA